VPFIKVKNTTHALGDIARYRRKQFHIPLIAVTGSNGKTTTKEMIACVLSKKFKVLKNEGTKNNQVGVPLTLLRLDSSYNIAVLELGTNHPGEIEYLTKVCQPNIGVITNIGPSHLEFLHSLKGVFREKHKLLESLGNPYLAVLNCDDAYLRKEALKKNKRPFIFGFGRRNHSDFSVSDVRHLSNRLEFRVNQKYKFTLDTLGYYNIYNALAAIAIARIFGMDYKDIASQLANFDFPQGRLKLIQLKQANFIDDTYNSNPFSLRQALDALANFTNKGRKIFVMGDMLELGRGAEPFHRQAGRRLAEICDALITVGTLSKFAAGAALSYGFDARNIFSCSSAKAAREILLNKIAPGPDDIVLVKGSRAMKMEEIFNN
jgi:UDP-N-acetylmuramoyl-tripeptide--D-alanyl-D-alanine ligase